LLLTQCLRRYCAWVNPTAQPSQALALQYSFFLTLLFLTFAPAGLTPAFGEQDQSRFFQGETYLAATHPSDLPPLQRQALTTTRSRFTSSNFTSSFLPA